MLLGHRQCPGAQVVERDRVAGQVGRAGPSRTARRTGRRSWARRTPARRRSGRRSGGRSARSSARGCGRSRATASRSSGSNMLWVRRSYQRRCIGASSVIVSTSLSAKPVGQLLGRGRGRDQVVVAGHAGGLVVAHAVGDQLDLVGEVVVDDAVAELGVLGDLAQAGAGVAELAEGGAGPTRRAGCDARRTSPRGCGWAARHRVLGGSPGSILGDFADFLDICPEKVLTLVKVRESGW